MPYKENNSSKTFLTSSIAEVTTHKFGMEEIFKNYIQRVMEIDHSWSIDSATRHAFLHAIASLAVYLMTKDGMMALATISATTGADLLLQIPKKIQQLRYIHQANALTDEIQSSNLGLERVREHDAQMIEQGMIGIATSLQDTFRKNSEESKENNS